MVRRKVKRIKDKDNQFLKTVKAVAMMGEFMGKDLKEKNTFKKRMLVAGLSKRGLSFPDDFDKLSEKEKKKRLDKALEVL